MSVARHPDWYDVVRRHWRKTTGFLLASREPCLTIQKQELAAVRGRSLASRDLGELDDWEPPTSWILGVVLCPGDSVEGIVEWVKARRLETERVWFYLHRSTPADVLKPWVVAGFETNQAAVVATWQELHKLYGLALNDRVYMDWS